MQGRHTSGLDVDARRGDGVASGEQDDGDFPRWAKGAVAYADHDVDSLAGMRKGGRQGQWLDYQVGHLIVPDLLMDAGGLRTTEGGWGYPGTEEDNRCGGMTAKHVCPPLFSGGF